MVFGLIVLWVFALAAVVDLPMIKRVERSQRRPTRTLGEFAFRYFKIRPFLFEQKASR